MVFDRFLGDAEMVGDFLVSHAFGDEFEDFGFSVAEDEQFGFVGLFVVFASSYVFDEFGGDLRRDFGFTAEREPDGIDDFLGGRGFEQVANGSGSENGCDRFLFFVDGEDDDLNVFFFLLQSLDKFDPVQARHVDVGKEDVGGIGEADVQRLLTVFADGDNLTLRHERQRALNRFSVSRFVVGNDDSDCRGHD